MQKEVIKWQEEVKKALLKSKNRLTELGLLVWIVLEIIYNMFYFNVSVPAPFIVEIQFIALTISFLSIRNKMQKNYYLPIISYYVYTLAVQILIYIGLDSRETIHIIDISAFIGCILALAFTVIKIK